MAKVKKSRRTTAKYRDLPTHSERMIARAAERATRVQTWAPAGARASNIAKFCRYWRGVYAAHGYSKRQRRAMAAASA